MLRIAAYAALAAFTALGAKPAPAQVLSLSEILEIRMLEGWRRADGTHMTALDIRLAPGWKTYWRSPGDGGIPMELSLNTTEAEIHWPRPDVFYTGTLRSIGYAGDVLLPLELMVGSGAQSVSGRVALGICQDVCMPVELEIEAMLPADGRPDPRIVAALSDRPLSAQEVGAGQATCRIRPIEDGLQVEARIPLPDIGGLEEVVFELPDQTIWISDPHTERSGGNLVAVADIVPAFGGPFALDRSDLRITVLGRREAVEILGCTAG